MKIGFNAAVKTITNCLHIDKTCINVFKGFTKFILKHTTAQPQPLAGELIRMRIWWVDSLNDVEKGRATAEPMRRMTDSCI